MTFAYSATLTQSPNDPTKAEFSMTIMPGNQQTTYYGGSTPSTPNSQAGTLGGHEADRNQGRRADGEVGRATDSIEGGRDLRGADARRGSEAILALHIAHRRDAGVVAGPRNVGGDIDH